MAFDVGDQWSDDQYSELTDADLIWNRACSENRTRSLPGDRALADLLRAHGLIMNGGVLHAVECLTLEQLADAESGYRFYGFDAAAMLLIRARRILATDDNLDSHERQLDLQYAELIPDDTTLVNRFEEHLQMNPKDYAPV
jgi:hypothetical protein